MGILVNVVNQKMYVSSTMEGIVAGSQRFVKFRFNLSEEWDGLMTFAQFMQNGVAYNQYLDKENCVYLPSEIGVGTCTLMLYGSHNTTIGTTNYLTLKINENILVSDASSTDISESLYTQLTTRINAITSWDGQSVTDLESDVQGLSAQLSKLELKVDGLTGLSPGESTILLEMQDRINDIESQLADLTYEPVNISIMQLSTSTAEVGSMVDVAIHVVTDKTAAKIEIFRGGSSSPVGSVVDNVSVTAVVSNVNADTTFRAVATDDRGHEAELSKTIHFYNGVYVGVGDADTLISSLTKSLQSGRASTFTVTAGVNEHVLYACPMRYGTPTFKVGGFEGGFALVEENISYTNPSGYTEAYQLWWSTNANLGTITVEVK